LSGPQAAQILARLFVPASGKLGPPASIRSHRLMFGYIHDPHTGERVDEVLAVLMRAPHSYTREDVVEIDCHGGTVPLQRVLGLCLREGSRLARPGEFTLRAFLNGRLDLAQAEAVLDVVRARSAEGLRLAVEQLGGGLSGRVRGVRSKLLHALAHLEATIDFPEDDVPPADVSPQLRDALANIEALIAGADTGIVLRQGVRTALVGRPNVGKSSLLNALLRTERAIVTPIPGTTRDTLEEVANVRGVPLVLTDTAGLRGHHDTEDPIEVIGMERTRRALAEADLVVMVFDGSQPLMPADVAIVDEVKRRGPPMRLAVINKSDLPRAFDPVQLGQALRDGEDREDGSGARRTEIEIVEASATQPGGTDRLEQKLAEIVLSGKVVPAPGEAVVTNVRHLDALRRARRHLEEAIASGEAGMPAAFVAVDLHSALNALGEITGETVGEDLLDEIFRNFCIGK
jgi:tRNA modification GTPase